MILPILLLFSCANHQATEPAPSGEVLQTTILADLLNKFVDDNFSMQNVAILAKTAYGMDFDREYQKILPRLITDDHALQVGTPGPYSQKVERDDRFFRHMLNGGKGTVILTEDSLIFRTKKERNKVFNFAMSYCQIKSIHNWRYFLWPNRIHIQRKGGGSYRLFTYKRKTLIRLTREKMATCATP